MSRKLWRWANLLCLVAWGLWSCWDRPVHAGCKPRAIAGKGAAVAKAKQPPVVLAITPLDVPVVIVVRPTVLYAYGRYAATYSSQGVPREEVPPTASSIVQQTCLACHGGVAPRAGLDLSHPEQLSPNQRLQAIARVVSDDATARMPPGPALKSAEIDRLLQELSQTEADSSR